jgi:HTH-type transcriptional regulator/antitoxin HigA
MQPRFEKDDMDIKPIRTASDYEAALKEVDRLIDAKPQTPEGDKLDVLVTLIEVYEAKHFPIPEPDDPVEVLQYYLDTRGISRSDLIPFLGSKERVSEVFSGKRRLSLAMIRRLHEGLDIPAELLIASGTPKAAHKSKGQQYTANSSTAGR